MAEPVEIATPSAERITPVCRHFGVCGGCTLQHWGGPGYLAWKEAQLTAALQRAGYPHPFLLPAAVSGPAERRRVDLAVRRTSSSVILGLHRLRSPDVVDLTECHVLDPTIVLLVAPLRTVLRRLQGLRREGSVIINLLDTGPDLLLRLDAALTSADRVALTAFAQEHAITRIAAAMGSDAAESACLLRRPVITLSGVPVTPPPGAFLQATRSGEAAIVAAVLAGLGDLGSRGRVAELYAGCGTLSFALVGRARVGAWEGDSWAADALRQAANHAGLAGRIEANRRDLVRQPLQHKELAGFDAIVLDPPHEGAAAQMPAIAASGAERVVYVSCNPAALGRDAAMLREAGYELAAVQLIDQFVWSARVEAVATFTRLRKT